MATAFKRCRRPRTRRACRPTRRSRPPPRRNPDVTRPRIGGRGMNVSVFGLGLRRQRLGGVISPRDGHTVIGVDVNADKVASHQRGPQPDRRAGARRAASRQASPTGGCARRPSTAEAVADTDVSLHLRRHAEPQERQPRSHVSRAGLRADRRRAPRQSRTTTSSSSAAPCCRARRTSVVIPALERDIGQEIRRRLRRLGQPGVPARGDGDQGLPQAAADARRPQPRGRRRADDGALRRRSTRRSSAPASASPR